MWSYINGWTWCTPGIYAIKARWACLRRPRAFKGKRRVTERDSVINTVRGRKRPTGTLSIQESFRANCLLLSLLPPAQAEAKWLLVVASSPTPALNTVDGWTSQWQTGGRPDQPIKHGVLEAVWPLWTTANLQLICYRAQSTRITSCPRNRICSLTDWSGKQWEKGRGKEVKA